jgi:hypothetical protein
MQLCSPQGGHVSKEAATICMYQKVWVTSGALVISIRTIVLVLVHCLNIYGICYNNYQAVDQFSGQTCPNIKGTWQ